MTQRYPIDNAARDRLRDAQKAEAEALRAVGAAGKTHQKARQSLIAAERDLAAAQVELVKISGAWRAAQLLNESVKLLRRVAREAGVKPSEIS